MFDWRSDHHQHQQQEQEVGDTIWAELNESEDHVGPYPESTVDSALVCVGDQKKNVGEAASISGLTEQTSGGQTEFPGSEKQPVAQASGHYSSTRLDMESWPDLPSLNATLDRDYIDDNIASTYLDFSSATSLQKVTGNTTVQLDGESEVFGNDHEEKSNSFLDCDWGNVGDFDDFDRLFSNSDSLFSNEMVANGSDFLSASSDLVDSTVESIPIPHVPLNKQLSYDHGSSSLLINERTSGTAKQGIKRDVQKRAAKSPRKTEERGKSKISKITSGIVQNHGQQHPRTSLHSLAKVSLQPVQTQYTLLHDSNNMRQLQHANQFLFPGYGYPAYPFSAIPLSNIQAEGHQIKTAAANYQTSTDSPKQSSSTEKSQDIPLMMTPQEKIEKLRRRQQMQALLAIQQQQQQFGQDGSGSDTLIPKAYSPKSKNPDSLGSSLVIDESTNKIFSPEQIPSANEEVQKSSIIQCDQFIEEKIYYQLQDALGKLDTRTRRCIQNSLIRLAHSASERQITSDKTSKDENEVSEDNTSYRRSPTKDAETNTNPIDRIVAHLLFHRPCSGVSTPAKDEIICSTPSSIEPDAPGEPSEDEQNGQDMALQPSL